MVIVGRLALLGEIAIRLRAMSVMFRVMMCQYAYLNTVLEAVQLFHPTSVFVFSGTHIHPCAQIGGQHWLFSRCTNLPAAVGDLASGLAD